MLADLARFAVGWPLVLSLAAVVTAQGRAYGRRRLALNEALHELRRPLQALVLSAPSGSVVGANLSRQAATALERLEREVNGEAREPRREAVEVVPLLVEAVARWRTLAARAGCSLALGTAPGAAGVLGDPGDLERALDNLIANAIEHGGDRVVVGAEVDARGGAGRLQIVVRDSGTESRGGAFARKGRANAPRSARSSIARFRGRARRGHGLRLVRRIAAAHGGELRWRSGDRGTEAAIELPLRRSGGAA